MAKKSTGTKPARKPTAKAAANRSAKSAKKPPATAKPGMRAKPAGQPADEKGATFYALLIGCDLYLPNSTKEGSYGSLHGCVSDAKRVEDFLKKRAGLTDANLIRLTSSPDSAGKITEPKEQWPTYENIVNGFKKLTQAAKAGDHVYVHYSGHGGRCPTMLPEVKGAKALDETLVPFNIGDKSARYVRDVEIAKLLKDMTSSGLVVTAVFDSCHSGGATRTAKRDDDPIGIRGVDFVDRTDRPKASEVGTPVELAEAAPPVDATRGTSEFRGVAPAGVDATRCVVLTACRPFELAREFRFDGGPSQGALTYWYLKTVGAGARLSFRTVFDQVVKRIHDQFPAQTPMLFGNPDRAILEGSTVTVAPSVPVAAVAGKEVTLGAGETSLVQMGVEYAVYPKSAKDLTNPKERAAIVRVTAVQATTATAEVVTKFGSRNLQTGDRAVAVGPPVTLVRKVAVRRPDGKSPKPTDDALRRVADALSGQTWVEPVDATDSEADFVVTTDEKGATYLIGDTSDVPIRIRPELPVKDASSARKVVDRLTHLARFQAIQTLENPDSASPLKGKVIVELLQTPAGFRKGDPTTGLKPFPVGGVPKLKAGEWVVLSVKNQSFRPINLVALDLASDWSVSIAHPDDRFIAINAGEVPFHLPLQAGLPPGHQEGSDLLKVIATVDPPPGFELLTLPALDQPIPPVSARGGATRSASLSPLGELLAAAGADRPTRALSTGTPTTSAWDVSHVKVEVG